ncbi:MAG: zinc ribbon domain-containing protein [Methanosphaera stadtmanae]|nr:zinc ribbon domain-containing protein [Methanosphaera stadtmanae]
MYCNKCGTEIKDGTQFCMNCGNPVEEKKDVKSIVKTKKAKLIVSIVLVLVIAVVGCLFGRRLLYKGYYENIAWSTSSEEANQILDEKYPDALFSVIQDKKTSNNIVMGVIDNYREMDASATPMLYFDKNDELEKVDVIFIIDKNADDSIEELIEKEKSELDKKYGKPEIIDYLAYKWETPKSFITLNKYADGIAMLNMEPRK